MKFDPNDAGVANGNYFALPFSVEESPLVIMSAPYDVTASYRGGAALSPEEIINASAQVDLYDISYGSLWRKGIGTLPLDENWIIEAEKLRRIAVRLIKKIESGNEMTSPRLMSLQNKINVAAHRFNRFIFDTASELLQQGKKVGLVGGDHSVPYGLLLALAQKHSSFGILHIDAHADLRPCYEGFEFSHASIMYNVIQHIPQVEKIVQVGVRDVCEQEWELIRSERRIRCFDMYSLAAALFEGQTWERQCREIAAALPKKVYISCDIDGLSPDNCPNTGTPVPGGLSFLQTEYLLRKLNEMGKEIVGFDLCETVAAPPNVWDAIVGARLLYKLCGCLLCEPR